jgi:quercetin dioxygenase-like cupin family protein
MEVEMRPFRLSLTGFTLTGFTAIVLFLACGDPTTSRQTSAPEITGPSFTAASGFSGVQLVRGNAGAFHIKSKADGFDVDIKAKDDTDVGVSNIVLAPGGNSGWHSHPGPVLAVVKSGTITLYDGSDPTCSPQRYSAGSVFLEHGGHTHISRNEGTVPVEFVATFFAPPAPSPSRIDEANPGNCPF